ncbi:hypothetical protein [Gaoshiqia sediminis]|uniref:Uncharacterized protein n=1 Tax=Gaoshiqia sediminis TaxID=2986998 RepID=A0AA42C8D3_9BACT|nr:hypothetical protein [Gaoshiqia sediminis]MCW0484579.1 hypothetical protein [Gaoshiqia sediminis]
MNKPHSYLFVKVLLLAFFLLLFNSWLAYHVGNNFIETYFANGVLVFFGFVSFLTKYLRKEQEEEIGEIYSRWLSAFLNFQVIAGLYVLFFMAGCFVSSVHIESNNNQPKAHIVLQAQEKENKQAATLELNEKSPTAKKTVLTIPFGRTFLLTTRGFQPYRFQVYPWVGKRIVLENDLQVSPTVVVRVRPENFVQLTRAKVRIQINANEPSVGSVESHAVIVVGQIPEIPSSYCERWHNELKGIYRDDVIIYSYLNRWCADEPLFLQADLQPYDSLRIELTSRDGDVFATSHGMVGTDPFLEFKFKTLQP